MFLSKRGDMACGEIQRKPSIGAQENALQRKSPILTFFRQPPLYTP